MSSLFMILYGDGEHMLVKFGILQISKEIIVRSSSIYENNYRFNVWYTNRTDFTNCNDFYSLMQHLKVKPNLLMLLWQRLEWFHL